MKKILSIFLVFALLFSLAACGSKKTEGVEIIRGEETADSNDLTAPPQDEIDDVGLQILEANNFCNGLAWIERKDAKSGNTVFSIINTDGKIIYSNDKISSVNDFKQDSCYIVEGSDESKVYKIIDKNGKETVSSASGAFDDIGAYGDNLFLVHKYQSDIDTSQHLYGVINSNGEFICKLRECPFEKTPLIEGSTYLGLGFFGFNLEGYVFNSNKDVYIECFNLPNNQADINEKVYLSLQGKNVYFDNVSEPKKIDSWYISISKDGAIAKVPEFRDVINNVLVTNDRFDQKLTLFDPVTNKSSVFTKYLVSEITAADNNFLLEVQGKDLKTYYILIDKNCNILFDPIQAISVQASDGKIVIKKEITFTVMDYKGATLFETADYGSIGEYHNGIAWAQKSTPDENTGYYFMCGIDSSGNVVIS